MPKAKEKQVEEVLEETQAEEAVEEVVEKEEVKKELNPQDFDDYGDYMKAKKEAEQNAR